MSALARAVASTLLLVAAHLAPAASRRPTALVALVQGEAATQARPGQPLAPRAWLRAGDVVVLAAEARVVLVFRSGRRFEARGPARVRVGRAAVRGPGLRELPALSPWPARVRPAEVRATSPAVVRVRSAGISAVFPSEGQAVLAHALALRFVPDAPAAEYTLEVREVLGRVVLRTRTDATELRLPPEILRPGAAYLWSVSGVTATGERLSGEAGFHVLDARLCATRARIERQVESPDARVYLDELDRALGLSR